MDLPEINALLRYFFHIDPDALSDEDFALRWRELQWVLKLTRPFSKD
ncbi:hypothetical protein [Fibrisoma montanum]|nr:hypothetical protein [Fibrisoma montanum]